MRNVFACIALCIVAACAWAQAAAPSNPDWSLIEKTLGRAPTEQGGVRKLLFWRTDFPVFVERTRVEPAAALTSWMAFREVPNGVVSDGDLVLLAPEVAPVMDALQQHGFEITGLHNHLIREHPEVLYMHFFARGELASIAEGLKVALAATKTPTRVTAPPAGTISYDRKAIEEALGKQGTATGSVLGFAFPRKEPPTTHGMPMPPAMGMATAVNFQPAPTGVAATGDFVLAETAVAPVLEALRKGGVVVTAIHNHLLEDNPRLIFVHFWMEGKADTVARALRAALDVAQ